MTTHLGFADASNRRMGRLLLAALLLAGCQLAPVNGALSDKNLTSGLSSNGDRLINEGVPVFLSGVVAVPAYFKGDLAALVIQATQLKGGAFAGVADSQVASDGTFTLKVPPSSKLFFVSTQFSQGGKNYHLRALVRAQPDTQVILDATSSLMGAPIAQAALVRSLDDLSFSETGELTSEVRAAYGAQLNGVDLSLMDSEQIKALNLAVPPSDAIGARLLKWETALANVPASPSPVIAWPTASAKPSAQPSATATPPVLGK